MILAILGSLEGTGLVLFACKYLPTSIHLINTKEIILFYSSLNAFQPYRPVPLPVMKM